ncbi:hypothetical protein [Arthrobacter caoxuetaonis]|uniref:Uncharacterized protein n=1 Tax=Arthrobacter caoxuetaonis TaxID=2886935 RepID=A0A9X1MEJ6_9MICC|nr:hypothetical protein [Arthrobacter caoxuetaonis]MCC3297517.1 hypothetical protein [Arthrobacter caoxuetaonis]USQ57952.1 hypothetical protein NF551_03610 [Arthrobacter caoxuetaonis]
MVLAWLARFVRFAWMPGVTGMPGFRSVSVSVAMAVTVAVAGRVAGAMSVSWGGGC